MSLTQVDELRIAINGNQSVLLVGPSGRGKSYMARNFDPHPNGVIQFTMSNQTEEETLFGHLVYDTDKQQYIHIDGPLTQAYGQGKRLVIDEITVTTADTAHVWHPVANKEPIAVKTDGYRMVERHPQFQFIATTNLEQYTGNYRLSPAFYSRFYIIEWEGFTRDEEAEFFVNKYPDAGIGFVSALVEIEHELQEKAAALNIQIAYGMREVERALTIFEQAKTLSSVTEDEARAAAYEAAFVRPTRLFAKDMTTLLQSLGENKIDGYLRA